MKRASAIFGIIMIIFMMAPHINVIAEASEEKLKIEETSPKDGAKGVPLDNMGVKVFFNQEVYSEENKKINEKACKLVDKDGKEIESIVVFNPKDKNVLLILAKGETKEGKKILIKPSTKYKLIIDESFKAANGQAIGKTQEITFSTLNPANSVKISMGMMGVMVVGMIIASSKAMKNSQKDEGKLEREEKFNPYKVAKETGKPLEEVIAAEKKRREKEAAKAARKAKNSHEDDDEEEYMEPGHYKVSKVRKVAEGGSSYITGRKAEAERKKEIEAKRKASSEVNKSKKSKKKKK